MPIIIIKIYKYQIVNNYGSRIDFFYFLVMNVVAS